MSEAHYIRKKFGKAIFFLAISIVYALRPMLFFKKAILPSEVVNFIVIAFTDFLIYYYWGPNALLYLLIGVWLSIGPHPAAVHVLAEHY